MVQFIIFSKYSNNNTYIPLNSNLNLPLISYSYTFHIMIFHFYPSNADATCNFFPCESVIFVQFPCSMTTNGKMIKNDYGNRWSRGCPMDDEFSGFYVIDGIKSKMYFFNLTMNIPLFNAE